MKKLLMLAMLAASFTGGAIAQETGSGEQGEATSDGSASNNGGAGSEATGSSAESGSGASSDTTNAQNAPFLGNRDRIGTFFSDEGMTTLRTGDEFTSAYNALSEADRAQIMSECGEALEGQRPFCDAFMAAGAN